MRVHSIAHRICTHTMRSYSASVIVGKVCELPKLLNVSITKQCIHLKFFISNNNNLLFTRSCHKGSTIQFISMEDRREND